MQKRERENEREWERERDDLNITELYTYMVFLINTLWFNIIQFWLNPAQALIKFFLDTLHLYGFTKVLKFGSYWYIIWLESLVPGTVWVNIFTCIWRYDRNKSNTWCDKIQLCWFHRNCINQAYIPDSDVRFFCLSTASKITFFASLSTEILL